MMPAWPLAEGPRRPLLAVSACAPSLPATDGPINAGPQLGMRPV